MQHPGRTTRRMIILVLALGALLAVALVYGPAAAQQADKGAPANVVYPDNNILIAGAEPYLGFGEGRNPFSQNIPPGINGGDPERIEYPNTRPQRFWLSINWAGTDKYFGDPFLVKYNCGNNGGLCNDPPRDQPNRPPEDYQEDYDNESVNGGYNFNINVGDGSGQLRVFDPAFANNPSSVANSWVPRLGGVQRYNNRSSWCHSNNPFAGDNIAASGGLGQVDQFNQVTIYVTPSPVPGPTQPPVPISVYRCRPGSENQFNLDAQQLTTTYTLYYPDDTPSYFGDDITVPNSRWEVGPVIYRATTSDTVPAEDYSRYNDPDDEPYHNKWVDYNTLADGSHPFAGSPAGGALSVFNANPNWRLNVNVNRTAAYQTDRRVDVHGQNNFSLVLAGASGTGAAISAIGKLPVYLTIPTGQSDIFLSRVPSEYRGRTMDVWMFDPGDVQANTAVIQLLHPPDSVHPDPYVQDNLTISVYPQADRSPEQPRTYIDDHFLAKSGTSQYGSNRWIKFSYRLPDDYEGGWWQLRYYVDGQSTDRMALAVRFSEVLCGAYNSRFDCTPTPPSGKPTNR